MKIIVASKNPVKINATLEGFKKVFPKVEFEIEGVSVESGVSNQPKTDKETFDGAYNRNFEAEKQFPNADYWVGIEGGVQAAGEGEIGSFAWVVISSKKKIGKARTGEFILPNKVAELIRAGMELGDADDHIFGDSNSKQKNGSIGILTKDVLTRATYYEPAVIMALIPFVNDELY